MEPFTRNDLLKPNQNLCFILQFGQVQVNEHEALSLAQFPLFSALSAATDYLHQFMHYFALNL